MSVIHLTHGDLYADLVRDRRAPEIWLYVIQREGSADVLAMGSCASEKGARAIATRLMLEFSEHDSSAASAS